MRIRAFILGVLAAGFFGSQTAQAQHYGQRRHYNAQGRPFYRGPVHLTFGAGTALYDGDLGNSPGNNFFGPAISAGGIYRLTAHLKIGGEFSYVELGARDQAKERGLAFTSTNGLGTVILRYDFIHDESIFAASQADAPTLQVYLQAGAGLMLYNPHSYIGTERANKNTPYLAPERNDYPALAGVLPLGGGFSVLLTDRLRAGVEGNYYLSSSDQLDDINNRLGGASLNKDGFATVMLKLDYELH